MTGPRSRDSTLPTLGRPKGCESASSGMEIPFVVADEFTASKIALSVGTERPEKPAQRARAGGAPVPYERSVPSRGSVFPSRVDDGDDGAADLAGKSAHSLTTCASSG